TTKWFAWLEEQLRAGKYHHRGEFFIGLAYENISATGANAALPHYSPTKGLSSAIDVHTPYLNDSGGQYRDGTCDTTRTVHFGHPSDEQCEAFTRVLKGHIAIDSAIFPQGTTGKQLDVLARHALWKDGLNYLVGVASLDVALRSLPCVFPSYVSFVIFSLHLVMALLIIVILVYSTVLVISVVESGGHWSGQGWGQVMGS
ncbi:hypothetical protein FRC06_006948, partial [Ceratobasidium sp. 370]